LSEFVSYSYLSFFLIQQPLINPGNLHTPLDFLQERSDKGRISTYAEPRRIALLSLSRIVKEQLTMERNMKVSRFAISVSAKTICSSVLYYTCWPISIQILLFYIVYYYTTYKQMSNFDCYNDMSTYILKNVIKNQQSSCWSHSNQRLFSATNE
jgi:hypothetical protein